MLSYFQVAMRRGTARSFDHAQLVHAQWLHIIRLNIQIFVKRVRSKDNIADLPSRKVSFVLQSQLSRCYFDKCVGQDFSLLRYMKAVYVKPSMADEYQQPDSWSILQERWKLLHGQG